MIADCQTPIADCRLDPPVFPLGKGGDTPVAHAPGSDRPVACAPGSDRRAAFTLVEMVIVIGIIILLAGLVLPAASQMWRDRKLADAQNMVSGMLMVARAKALEGNAGETGLFFYLDDQNVQHVAAISQDSGDGRNDWQTQPQWHNVFHGVKQPRLYNPAPMSPLATQFVKTPLAAPLARI